MATPADLITTLPDGAISVLSIQFTGKITIKPATHTLYEQVSIYPNRKSTVTVKIDKEKSKDVKKYQVYKDGNGYTYIKASEILGKKTIVIIAEDFFIDKFHLWEYLTIMIRCRRSR